MADDLAYYYGQRRDLREKIISKENELKKLRKEYDEIEKAYKELKEDKLDVVNKAKEIEKKAKSKNSGANLEWRGERKKSFDEYMNDESARLAKKFREAVETFKKEINEEKKEKQKKINTVDDKLHRGYFCLYAQLRRISDRIDKLEREG